LLTSFVLTYLIIKSEHLHQNYSHDNDFKKVQNFHKTAVPRVGGLVIFISLFVGLAYQRFYWLTEAPVFSILIISSLPVFITGIAEDLTKQVSIILRLLASIISAFIAIYILDAQLERIGWIWFDDNVLTLYLVSLSLSIFMVSGVSHSINIIDGFNGLMLGYVILALLAFAYVAFQVGDLLIQNLIYIIVASSSGLFCFNFFRGSIFSGDSGAYLLGFFLAMISLLLIARNPMISPWFPLLVIIYPVFETIFSIYRKKFLRNTSPGNPDGLHFHMLIFQRVSPFIFNKPLLNKKTRERKNFHLRHMQTSILIWLLSMFSFIPAIIWWDNDFILILSILIFCLIYTYIYFSIIRFKFKLK
jgi:UDP-GlcNAc:undecaprenyl-phosphate/decaprenyl-phosphate GlcNAc-1-phosphate transferase